MTDWDEVMPCRPDEGKHPADRHLAFQFWQTDKQEYETFMTRPERKVRHTLDNINPVRMGKLGPVTINGRPAGRDLQRFCEHWWSTAPFPHHMHIPRAVWTWRKRMTKMHSAYRMKRSHW